MAVFRLGVLMVLALPSTVMVNIESNGALDLARKIPMSLPCLIPNQLHLAVTHLLIQSH
jgi:hypothetical protein